MLKNTYYNDLHLIIWRRQRSDVHFRCFALKGLLFGNRSRVKSMGVLALSLKCPRAIQIDWITRLISRAFWSTDLDIFLHVRQFLRISPKDLNRKYKTSIILNKNHEKDILYLINDHTKFQKITRFKEKSNLLEKYKILFLEVLSIVDLKYILIWNFFLSNLTFLVWFGRVNFLSV